MVTGHWSSDIGTGQTWDYIVLHNFNTYNYKDNTLVWNTQTQKHIYMHVLCFLSCLTDFFTLTVTSFVNQIMKYQFKTLAPSIGPIIAMSEGDLSAHKYKHYKPFKIST